MQGTAVSIPGHARNSSELSMLSKEQQWLGVMLVVGLGDQYLLLKLYASLNLDIECVPEDMRSHPKLAHKHNCRTFLL